MILYHSLLVILVQDIVPYSMGHVGTGSVGRGHLMTWCFPMIFYHTLWVMLVQEVFDGGHLMTQRLPMFFLPYSMGHFGTYRKCWTGSLDDMALPYAIVSLSFGHVGTESVGRGHLMTWHFPMIFYHTLWVMLVQGVLDGVT